MACAREKDRQIAHYLDNNHNIDEKQTSKVLILVIFLTNIVKNSVLHNDVLIYNYTDW